MIESLTEHTSKRRGRSVTVMDYGVGNLGSLSGTLRRLGYHVRVARTPDDVTGSDAVILPGVGAMPFAIAQLQKSGLDREIARLMQDGSVPIIGICLGMQLMFAHSEEGDCPGLGLLEGRVRGFSDGDCHVGWNTCKTPVAADENGNWSTAAFYFNHSYYVEAAPEVLCSSVEVDGHGIVGAIVQSGTFTGLQFHPEKSQVAGADLLRHLIDNQSTPAKLELDHA